MPATRLLALAAVIGSTFVVSAVLTALLARGRLRFLHVLDHPNERSLHARPVPRTGGLALLGGLFCGLLLALLFSLIPLLPPVGLQPLQLQAPLDSLSQPLPQPSSQPSSQPLPQPLPSQTLAPLPWLGAALLLVAAVSFWDDRVGLSRRLRLLVHVAAAALLWMGGLRWDQLGLPGPIIPLPLLLALPLTLLYAVWMLNLYNFMDGMDGLAGGMASIGFAGLALLGYNAGDLTYAACCALVAAASAGFLTGNLPPARIFLGDVGSSSLGLLAAGFTLWGSSAGRFPLWVGWLIFSPFIVDATWTLLRRAKQGERLWDAHRSHHYQRLVLAGWGHRRTLGWALALIAAATASAIAASSLTTSEQWQLIAGWAAIFILIHLRVGLAERVARG
ncbi:glycosyl transferase [Lamprobacter modestohalophilus]|uniref:glycosyl transferase n=1 Tax=Lamprobacter modestohalophilus TaxID=1064514 RepID=UPI001F5B6A54|nr:glycosyl transferase [Lamprobacter modestohalophilus]